MKTLILCILLTLPYTLLAGNTLDLTGNPTATPVVAFSVRKLSSAYTGYAIRVRRSSDGSSKDIDFTPAGDLDTMLLKTFVGTDTGYVSTWYDQSGNGYDATQNTLSDQPTIMVGGVINRDNGQPSIYTSGTGFLEYGPISQLAGTTPVTRTEVCRSRDAAGLAITEGLGTYQLDLEMFPTALWVQFENHNITATAALSNTTTLMSINSVRNSGASQLYINTALQGTATSAILPFTSPVMGYIGIRFDNSVSNNAGEGAFSEMILFPSVLSDADRQSINYNENWYYLLGFDPCSVTQAALSPNGMTDKALYACTQDGPWAYYYDPAHPLNLLFGIAKDPGNTGANPTFVADSINLTTTTDPTTIYYSATSGQQGIFALGRYWNVYTRTPLTSPVNVRFFYNPADTLAALNAAKAFKSSSGASTITNLQWFKTVGDPFNQDSLTATPVAGVKGPVITLAPAYGTKNGVNYAEFDGVAGFSGGTGVYIVSNTLITLPITVSSFSGVCASNSVLLTWTINTVSNSLQLEIQRSADGSSWEQIGQTGAAESDFTDANPLKGANNFYRLKLADADGRSTYSGVIVVNSCNAAATAPQLFRIVPDPFGSSMSIACTIPNNGPVEVQIEDVTGATLLRRKYTAGKGNNVFALTGLDNLAKGTYIVLVVQDALVVGVSKVIKE